MKTKVELERDILNITTTIHQKFPELTKYIVEMPQNNFEEGEINTKILEDYYQSLEELINNYANTHKSANAKKDH